MWNEELRCVEMKRERKQFGRIVFLDPQAAFGLPELPWWTCHSRRDEYELATEHDKRPRDWTREEYDYVPLLRVHGYCKEFDIAANRWDAAAVKGFAEILEKHGAGPASRDCLVRGGGRHGSLPWAGRTRGLHAFVSFRRGSGASSGCLVDARRSVSAAGCLPNPSRQGVSAGCHSAGGVRMDAHETDEKQKGLIC